MEQDQHESSTRQRVQDHQCREIFKFSLLNYIKMSLRRRMEYMLHKFRVSRMKSWLISLINPGEERRRQQRRVTRRAKLLIAKWMREKWGVFELIIMCVNLHVTRPASSHEREQSMMGRANHFSTSSVADEVVLCAKRIITASWRGCSNII